MKKLSVLTVATASLALAACGTSAPEETPTDEAANYAARINGEQTAQAQPAPIETASPSAGPSVASGVTPSAAEPLEAGVPNNYAPGTASDPNSACNANLFGQFVGQQPDAEVRAQIMEAAADIPEVRFIAPGSDYIKPDPTHPRLNVMIAVDGVIRDIRCG
ncbi:MAG: hypothetical protein AAGA34_06975 [Pseudomonadota bacterium]